MATLFSMPDSVWKVVAEMEPLIIPTVRLACLRCDHLGIFLFRTLAIRVQRDLYRRVYHELARGIRCAETKQSIISTKLAALVQQCPHPHLQEYEERLWYAGSQYGAMTVRCCSECGFYDDGPSPREAHVIESLERFVY